MIVRRCCWNNCGDGISSYEGRLTYFCSEDECNGEDADINLIGGGSGEEPESTTTISTSVSVFPSTTTTTTGTYKYNTKI